MAAVSGNLKENHVNIIVSICCISSFQGHLHVCCDTKPFWINQPEALRKEGKKEGKNVFTYFTASLKIQYKAWIVGMAWNRPIHP